MKLNPLCYVSHTGRYLFLSAIANQLRFPNSHTHYFSCILLYLFSEGNQEIVKEQVTRYSLLLAKVYKLTRLSSNTVVL